MKKIITFLLLLITFNSQAEEIDKKESENKRKKILIEKNIKKYTENIRLFRGRQRAKNNTSTNVSQSYAIISGDLFNYTPLNNQFKNLAEFNTQSVSWGTGAHGINNGLVIGGQNLNGITQQSRPFTDSEHDYYISSQSNIIGNLGYVVYSTKNLKIYPLISTGIGRTTLDVVRKTDIATSVNDLVENPNRGVTVTTTSLIGDIALGADYLIKFGKTKPRKGGLYVGLRSGYSFSMYNTNWNWRNVSLPNTGTGYNRFYTQFMIGVHGNFIAAFLDLF